MSPSVLTVRAKTGNFYVKEQSNTEQSTNSHPLSYVQDTRFLKHGNEIFHFRQDVSFNISSARENVEERLITFA